MEGDRPRVGRGDRPDRAGGVRVLLVDDEPDIVRAYQEGLEDAGFVVSIARDGAAALDAVCFSRPDVVVLDLLMPAMNGWPCSATLPICERVQIDG